MSRRCRKNFCLGGCGKVTPTGQRDTTRARQGLHEIFLLETVDYTREEQCGINRYHHCIQVLLTSNIIVGSIMPGGRILVGVWWQTCWCWCFGEEFSTKEDLLWKDLTVKLDRVWTFLKDWTLVSRYFLHIYFFPLNIKRGC